MPELGYRFPEASTQRGGGFSPFPGRLMASRDGPSAFVVDRMLGRLAKALRMLGYDALYWTGDNDAILDKAREESRILLTRRRALLKYRGEVEVVLIPQDRPLDQLRSLLRTLDLPLSGIPILSRCLRCNTPLTSIPKEEVMDRVPDHVYQTQTEFSSCRRCRRIYWRGTHRSHMERTIERLREEEGL